MEEIIINAGTAAARSARRRSAARSRFSGRRIAGLGAVAVVVLAACSGGEDENQADGEPTVPTIAPETAPRGGQSETGDGTDGPTDGASDTAGDDTAETDPEDPSETADEVTQVPAIEVRPIREEEVSDRQIERFEIAEADWLADAHGSVWVKRNDGALDRIDPTTDEVTTSVEVHEEGENCAGIGGTIDQLWVCTGPDSIGRVEPWGNTVDLVVEVDKAMEQGTLPIAFDHVWVLTDDGNSLSGVGLFTGTVDRQFDLPVDCAELAAGEDALWAACPDDGVVLKIDPLDGSELARADDLPGTRNLAAGNAIYAGFNGGTARLDPETAMVTGAVNIGPGTSAGELETSQGVVWVRAEGTLLRSFDGRSLSFLDEITAPENSGGDVLFAYDSVWTSAYTEGVVYRLRPFDFD